MPPQVVERLTLAQSYLRALTGSGFGDLIAKNRGHVAANLAQQSEDLSNALWIGTHLSGALATGIRNPRGDGLLTKLSEDGSANVFHQLQLESPTAVFALNASSISTTSCHFRLGEGRTWAMLGIAEDGGAGYAQAWFDLQNGVPGEVQESSGFVISSVLMEEDPRSPGLWRCWLTTENQGIVAGVPYLGTAPGDGVDQFDGDAAAYIYGWGVQVLDFSDVPGNYTPNPRVAGRDFWEAPELCPPEEYARALIPYAEELARQAAQI